MTPLNISSVRTFTPQVWAAALVWLATRLGVGLSADVALVVVPVVGAVVYRAARVIEARWPTAGWVLLGNGTPPSYAPKPGGDQ